MTTRRPCCGLSNEAIDLAPSGLIQTTHEYSSLIKGKGKGCQICFAIFRSIEILTEDWRRGQPLAEYLRSFTWQPPSLLRYRYSEGRPLEVCATLYVTDPRDFDLPLPDGKKRVPYRTGLCFEIFIGASDAWPKPLKAFGPARVVTPKLKADRRARLVKEWIQNCKKNHSFCWDRDPNLHGPRRVLDLSGNPRCRIRLIDNFERWMGEYAIFTVPCVKDRPDPALASKFTAYLTPDNHKSLTKSIRWNDLPTAYKDAVVVASEQGIRYLWIHPLCVMQYDDEDYYNHIKHSQDIYMGACLNISPSRIQDVGASFLGHRKLSLPDRKEFGPEVGDPKARSDKEMKVHQMVLSHKRERFTVYMRRMFCISHDTFGSRDCPLAHYPTMAKNLQRSRSRQDYAMSPTLSSTWGFVARMVSRRTLHFHASEMVFECRMGIQCECSLAPAIKGTGLLPADLRCSKLPHLGGWTDRPGIKWKMIVTQFTHLSMPTQQRLHALAGLLPLFEYHLGQKSCAGLFAADKRDLARQLLWMVTKSSSERSESFRCDSAWQPSWSWVSMVTKGTDTVLPSIQGHVYVDPEVQISEPSFICPAQRLDEFSRFIALSWSLVVRGRLMLGKISPKFRKHSGHSFVPAGDPLLDYFIPPPPTGMRMVDKKHTNAVGFYPYSKMHRFFLQSLHDHTPRALFMWDCDKWAAKQVAISGASPIYAYFLRIGGVNILNSGRPVDEAPAGLDNQVKETIDWDLDVGLVLRSASESAKAHFGSFSDMDKHKSQGQSFSPSAPCLERIGVFSVPRSRGYFDNAEVQSMTIL